METHARSCSIIKFLSALVRKYESAIDSIPVGAMVIITDESDVIEPPVDEEGTTKSTIAILGIAKLGDVILGKKE